MCVISDLWNWRRNARERENRLRFVEDYVNSEINTKRVIYQCQIREKARVRQMG